MNGVKFLNAPYSSFISDKSFSGTVLLRVDTISQPNSWGMIATLVTDTTLYKIKSSEELRAYVARNMNKPGFYGKKLHFRKKFEFNSFR
ncbi:hypothetical protein GCM10023093_31120 [Nemorincola caseinilytica]|uniref:Uncharacterized protein n=1 Tax=Nemorincola caseinilytica TaxID=2054315 RepID=A0ABP8NRQ9_9BACT